MALVRWDRDYLAPFGFSAVASVTNWLRRT